MQYAPTTGYVRSFEIPMRFLNWVLMLLQKTVSFSSPSGPPVGRIQYAPTTGYVWLFEIPMRSPDRVRARVQKMDLYTPPSVASGGAYVIRPYDRVRAILRNTDAISQLGTYAPSKNCLVFVPFGAVGWGVFNTPLQPGTCDPSKYRCNSSTGYLCSFKKLSRFRHFRGRLWGVFNTPLQPGTCGSSKYRCNFPTGYMQSYEILMRSLERRGRGVWEVGRWGLPFAGEVGVNKFGEEEDDDQDDDDEGARGDLQHKRQP